MEGEEEKEREEEEEEKDEGFGRAAGLTARFDKRFFLIIRGHGKWLA